VESYSHIAEEQLEQYALGHLPDGDVERIEEHLLICTSCQDQLDGVADFQIGTKGALQSEPALLRPALSTDWSGWLRRHPAFSMAVGFATLILAIGLFSRSRLQFAPVATLQLTALRGEMPVAAAAREFDLTLTDGPRSGGPFRVEVVGSLGQTMWNGLAESGASGIEVKVLQRLGPGDYFVRLYSDSGKVLHEYGFHVHA
jgi:hypothetical protein